MLIKDFHTVLHVCEHRLDVAHPVLILMGALPFTLSLQLERNKQSGNDGAV